MSLSPNDRLQNNPDHKRSPRHTIASVEDIDMAPPVAREERHRAAGYPRILEEHLSFPSTSHGNGNSTGMHTPQPLDHEEEDSASRSFHTAKSFESPPMVESIGSRHGSEQFMSCREGSDRAMLTGYMSDPEIQSDVDEASFHTCSRFNDQGLRSAISGPTKQNQDGQFNIPLQVFTTSIENAAEKRKAERRRRRLVWLPLRIFGGLVAVSSIVATTIILVGKRDRSRTVALLPQSHVPSLVPSVPTRESSSPTTVPAAIQSSAILETHVPSMLPSMQARKSSSPITVARPTQSFTAESKSSPPSLLSSTEVIALDESISPSVIPSLAFDMSHTATPDGSSKSPPSKSRATMAPTSTPIPTKEPTMVPIYPSTPSPKPTVSPSEEEAHSAPSTQPFSSHPPSAIPSSFWFETNNFVLLKVFKDANKENPS